MAFSQFKSSIASCISSGLNLLCSRRLPARASHQTYSSNDVSLQEATVPILDSQPVIEAHDAVSEPLVAEVEVQKHPAEPLAAEVDAQKLVSALPASEPVSADVQVLEAVADPLPAAEVDAQELVSVLPAVEVDKAALEPVIADVEAREAVADPPAAAEVDAQEPVSELPITGVTDASAGQLPASLANVLGSGGFTYLIDKDKELPLTVLQKDAELQSSSPSPCVDSLSPEPSHRNSEAEEPTLLGAGSDDRCLACGKSDGPLKRCSRCRSVRFCSVECQRAAWKAHKSDCARLARANGSQAESPQKLQTPGLSPSKETLRNLSDSIVAEDESKGAALFHEGRYREALAAFKSMESAACAAGLVKEEGRALRLIGNAMDKMNAADAEVEDVYKRALRIAHQQDDMDLSFNVLLGMGSHALKTEDLEIAEHFYLQAQMLAQRVLSQEEESIAESNLAMCLAMSDSRRAESFSHFRKAISLGGSNKHSRAALHSNFASALSADGKMAEAQKQYTSALAVAREVGNQRVEMNVLVNLANLYETELKQHDEARACRQRLAMLGRAHAGNTDENPVCAICLDVLEVQGDEHKEVVVLQCRHAYHAACWKGCQQNGVGNECPLCRDPLAFHAR